MSGAAKPQETYHVEDPQQSDDLISRRHQPLFMTAEEFLDWVDEDTLAEWVDGVVVMTSPASLRYQEIANFLLSVLSTFAQVHSLGKALNGYMMRLGRAFREPDALYVSRDHLHQFKKNYLDGPADLVVEIVSPDSEERDRSTKLHEYQEIGILEYWLIDPDPQQAKFYQLDAEGHYQLAEPDPNGIYQSKVLPGFWLRVDWLWQEPLPDPTQALLEIDRDTYAQYLREQIRQAGIE